MNPIHLSVYIWMFLNELQRDMFVEFPRTFFNFSEINDDGVVLGTALFENFNITGLETIVSEINNIEVTEDDNGDNDVCVYVPTGFLQLVTDYDFDIGIANEIPIYGEGKFQFSCHDIDLKICTFVSFEGGYVKNVNVNLRYQHNPIIFTGFWRNEEATELIERFLNVFNWIFAMWIAYEPDRASCVFSPFVEYIFNHNMGNEDNNLTFNSTCFQEILNDLQGGGKYFEEYLYAGIQENYASDDTLKLFLEGNKHSLSGWYDYLLSIIRRVVNN